MARCDLCQLSDDPIERCAFGENGVSLMLHPVCQDEFRKLTRKEQNIALDEAKRVNWRELGKIWQW